MAVPLHDQVYVSGQISPEDLTEFAQHGFKTVICNRPDGEAMDQPAFEEIQQAASALGMKTHFLPVVSGQLQASTVEEFARVLAESEGPVLAYCRSGMRSTTLWALSQAGQHSAEDLITWAAAAGYDITPLAPRLEAALKK